MYELSEKKLVKTISILLIILSSVLSVKIANSTSSPESWITRMHFLGDGSVWVWVADARDVSYFDAEDSNRPGCTRTINPNSFIVDGSTASGQVQVSGLMMAYTTKQKVKIKGTNDCRSRGDVESISHIEVY